MPIKLTESSSPYPDLDTMELTSFLRIMNEEDQKVPAAIALQIPHIEKLILAITEKLKNGGRLFYLGAGTSGRLGVLDASECPPTFGVPQDMVIGIIAGGDEALKKAVENAEDQEEQGWLDLRKHHINSRDVVIGISASGDAPYVLKCLEKCRSENIITGSLSCNPNAAVSAISNFPLEIITGPEVLTGSTRLKAGSAQKMVLNMISTAVMIQLGKISGNKMVNMQLTNQKLKNRALNMLMETLEIDLNNAEILLNRYGSVKEALKNYH